MPLLLMVDCSLQKSPVTQALQLLPTDSRHGVLQNPIEPESTEPVCTESPCIVERHKPSRRHWAAAVHVGSVEPRDTQSTAGISPQSVAVINTPENPQWQDVLRIMSLDAHAHSMAVRGSAVLNTQHASKDQVSNKHTMQQLEVHQSNQLSYGKLLRLIDGMSCSNLTLPQADMSTKVPQSPVAAMAAVTAATQQLSLCQSVTVATSIASLQPDDWDSQLQSPEPAKPVGLGWMGDPHKWALCGERAYALEQSFAFCSPARGIETTCSISVPATDASMLVTDADGKLHCTQDSAPAMRAATPEQPGTISNYSQQHFSHSSPSTTAAACATGSSAMAAAASAPATANAIQSSQHCADGMNQLLLLMSLDQSAHFLTDDDSAMASPMVLMSSPRLLDAQLAGTSTPMSSPGSFTFAASRTVRTPTFGLAATTQPSPDACTPLAADNGNAHDSTDCTPHAAFGLWPYETEQRMDMQDVSEHTPGVECTGHSQCMPDQLLQLLDVSDSETPMSRAGSCQPHDAVSPVAFDTNDTQRAHFDAFSPQSDVEKGRKAKTAARKPGIGRRLGSSDLRQLLVRQNRPHSVKPGGRHRKSILGADFDHPSDSEGSVLSDPGTGFYATPHTSPGFARSRRLMHSSWYRSSSRRTNASADVSPSTGLQSIMVKMERNLNPYAVQSLIEHAEACEKKILLLEQQLCKVCCRGPVTTSLDNKHKSNP